MALPPHTLDNIYATLTNLYVACVTKDEPRFRMEFGTLDDATQRRISQLVPLPFPSSPTFRDLKTAITIISSETFAALTPEEQTQVEVFSDSIAEQVITEMIVHEGLSFSTEIEHQRAIVQRKSKFLTQSPDFIHLKAMRRLFKEQREASEKTEKAFKTLRLMYFAAKRKDSGIYQALFYSLPDVFKAHIKELNLEYNSNNTSERLSYSVMVIDIIAKEKFHSLSSDLKTQVIQLADFYRTKKTTVPGSSLEKYEGAARNEETPVLLRSLALLARDTTIQMQKRFQR